jgi:HEAT repeat protein
MMNRLWQTIKQLWVWLTRLFNNDTDPPPEPLPEGAEVLLALILDGTESDQEFAIQSLIEMGRPAVPILIEAAHARTLHIRLLALNALSQIDDDTRVVLTLLDALKDREAVVRQAAARGLGNLGDSVAILALQSMLRDRDSIVRDAAGAALLKLGEASIPGLIDMLRERDYRVQNATAGVLAQFGIQALPALIKTLRHRDWYARRGAVKALARLEDEQAVQELIERLGGDQKSVQREIAGALEQIGTPEAVAAVKAWEAQEAV